MLADCLTKDKAEPADLLRACIRHGVYQLADEVTVLARVATERQHRKPLTTSKRPTTPVSNGQDGIHRRVEGEAQPDGESGGTGGRRKRDSRLGDAVCDQRPDPIGLVGDLFTTT